MIKYIRKLLLELMLNGKSLLAWLVLEIPGISDYPGLVEALQALSANPTRQNLINVLWQALFAGAAGHRLIKVLANAAR